MGHFWLTYLFQEQANSETFFVLYKKKCVWFINKLKADRSSPETLWLFEISSLFVPHLWLTSLLV